MNVKLRVELPPHELGHASMPPPETSVSILASALQRIQASPFPARVDAGLHDTLRYLGPEMPSLALRLAMSNLWLTGSLVENQLAAKPSSNAILRTTIAPTMIEGGIETNVLPQQASAILNLRLLPGDSISDALEYLRQTIDEPRVIVSKLPFSKEASPRSSIHSNAFYQLHRTVREISPDAVVAPFVLVGGTDSTHYQDICENIYRFIPARVAERDTQRFHGIDERIALQDYVDIVRFFYRCIPNLAGS